MPAIYLSPSVQDHRPYIIGGDEEYFMNLIADAMVPYLRTNGISFARNNPGVTTEEVIHQSNMGDYGLHLTLHTSSSPEDLRGVFRGPDVYYYTTSEEGIKAAELFAKNLADIYPDKDLVTVIPTTIIAELRETKAPAVQVELAYHDNFADASWLCENIGLIAKSLVASAAEFFGISFTDP